MLSAKSTLGLKLTDFSLEENLGPLKNIHVTNSLGIRSAARTPSDCELGHGSDTPDESNSLENVEQMAVERV